MKLIFVEYGKHTDSILKVEEYNKQVTSNISVFPLLASRNTP